MPNTRDINILEPPYKILLVAQNGMGKSIVANSFPEPRDEDFDIRMKPVAAYYPGKSIDYTSWTSDNFNQFVQRIHDIIDGRFNPTFKTWILDSVTGCSITSITYQLRVKDKIKTTKGGLPSTSWDEINGETVLFHEIIEAANILYTKHKINIIFTAHPVPKTEGTGEDAKRVTSLAAYGNKIPAIIPGFFDEIYNIQLAQTGLKDGKVKQFSRTVYTSPMNDLPGKTALDKYLPDSFDITGKNFYDVWTSYLKPKV